MLYIWAKSSAKLLYNLNSHAIPNFSSETERYFFCDVHVVVVVVDIRTHMFFQTCLFFPLSLVIFSMYYVRSRFTRILKVYRLIQFPLYNDFYTLIL